MMLTRSGLPEPKPKTGARSLRTFQSISIPVRRSRPTPGLEKPTKTKSQMDVASRSVRRGQDSPKQICAQPERSCGAKLLPSGLKAHQGQRCGSSSMTPCQLVHHVGLPHTTLRVRPANGSMNSLKRKSSVGSLREVRVLGAHLLFPPKTLPSTRSRGNGGWSSTIAESMQGHSAQYITCGGPLMLCPVRLVQHG